MSEAVSLIMTQNWPWDSWIAVKKNLWWNSHFCALFSCPYAWRDFLQWSNLFLNDNYSKFEKWCCACFTVSVRQLFFKFKGYLCYKMIKSQNVSSEAQFKNFFIFRKVILNSQDVQVFVFLTVPWFTKSLLSWWVLVDETVHFFFANW